MKWFWFPIAIVASIAGIWSEMNGDTQRVYFCITVSLIALAVIEIKDW